MASYYVDYTNGDDTTGDGSSGTPWKTIAHAITTASWAAHDTLYLANTGNHILASTVTLPAFEGICVRAWDNGGSASLTDGQNNTITPAAIIDGNSAAVDCINFGDQYQILYQIKMTGSTTYSAEAASGKDRFYMIQCEYDMPVDYNNFEGFQHNCYGHIASGGPNILHAGACTYCWFETSVQNVWNYTSVKQAHFVHCKVTTDGASNLLIDDQYGLNVRCSINQDGSPGAAWPMANVRFNAILDCVFSGAGSRNILQAQTTGGGVILNTTYKLGGNLWHNANRPPLADNLTEESSEPLTDASNGDFSLVSGAQAETASDLENSFAGADIVDAGGGSSEHSSVFVS